MKKYRVRLIYHATVDVEVEANNAEEAISAATESAEKDVILENLCLDDESSAEEI